jgi:hypothetical protein
MPRLDGFGVVQEARSAGYQTSGHVRVLPRQCGPPALIASAPDLGPPNTAGLLP